MTARGIYIGQNFIKKSTSYYLDLILILAQKEIKTRYKTNVLGYFWSIANPLAYTFIFYFAFELIFKARVENYVIFLISGLFAWQWTSNYLIGSTKAFIGNANLIKKTHFPRFILPLSQCLQDTFHFVMALPVIFSFLIYYQTPFTIWTFLGIPIMMAIQFAFLFGFALVLGSLNLFFRDIENLTGIVLQMSFYLTPILYTMDMVPERFRELVMLNPFAPFILSWKSVFLNGAIRMDLLGYCLVYTTISLIVGSLVYRKMVWKFSEAL